jgi:hypothetical protein
VINGARHFIHSMSNYHNNHSKDVPIRAGSITSGPERGAYPITDRSSLEDAMHAYGRAKDKEVAKQHIVAKAKALGLTDILPTDRRGSTKKS